MSKPNLRRAAHPAARLAVGDKIYRRGMEFTVQQVMPRSVYLNAAERERDERLLPENLLSRMEALVDRAEIENDMYLSAPLFPLA